MCVFAPPILPNIGERVTHALDTERGEWGWGFGGRLLLEESEVQAHAGNPSVLSGYVFGGGLEFTGVLFPLQLRLSLNRRESRNTHPRLPRGKDQFQGSQNHIRSFGFSAMLRNQDSANPDLESALIICKQSSVGEGWLALFWCLQRSWGPRTAIYVSSYYPEGPFMALCGDPGAFSLGRPEDLLRVGLKFLCIRDWGKSEQLKKILDDVTKYSR